jgi:hypothetical protein
MSRVTKTVDRNPHTGEAMKSKPNTDNYREHWETIFGKPKSKECEICGAYIDDWQFCKERSCDKKDLK